MNTTKRITPTMLRVSIARHLVRQRAICERLGVKETWLSAALAGRIALSQFEAVQIAQAIRDLAAERRAKQTSLTPPKDRAAQPVPRAQRTQKPESPGWHQGFRYS